MPELENVYASARAAERVNKELVLNAGKGNRFSIFVQGFLPAGWLSGRRSVETAEEAGDDQDRAREV